MTRPRLLDLFCGAGGAGMGYHRAGFDVVGVDLATQPHYPFEFHQADALSFPLDGFDAIHASPPCQAYSNAWRIRYREHPDLIAPVRKRLVASGLPYVIENVPGAPLLSPVELCGTMFPGLRTYRHRHFEASCALTVPPHESHVHRQAKMGRPVADGEWIQVVGNFSDVRLARAAMGIDWMTRDELREAIPPAYTEWIGGQLMIGVCELCGDRAHLRQVVVAPGHKAKVKRGGMDRIVWIEPRTALICRAHKTQRPRAERLPREGVWPNTDKLHPQREQLW